MEDFSKIVNYLVELPQKGALLGVKIFFIIFSVFLTAGIVYLLFVTDWFEQRIGFDLTTFFRRKVFKKDDKIAKRWQRIKEKIEKGSEADFKLAVIKSEDFFMKILSRKGFKGKTLLEQLEKIAPEFLPSNVFNELLKAHQVRNNIINDPNYKLTRREAKKTIEIFEKVSESLTES